jgi:DNA-binding MurR/RpiR family transcriptional regulator
MAMRKAEGKSSEAKSSEAKSSEAKSSDAKSSDAKSAEAKSSEAKSAGTGDVIEELRRRYDRLTESQRRIAEYIVEHSQAVAFATVDQMAAELDVNPSTIVRFTYRLGLNGFPDLQERMRQLVRGQLSRTGDPVGEGQVASHLEGTTFGASLSSDWQNLHRTIAGLNADTFARAISILTRAHRIYVAAGFSTFPVAHYFALVLDRLRSDISLLASNDAFATPRFVEIASDDCVLAFTFPRYAAATHRIVMWAKEHKAKVIAVTDTPISAVGQVADIVLIAGSAGPGLQNSLVAPMAIANALLNGVAAAKGTTAHERYNRHDRLMHRWDAFMLKPNATD